MLEELSTPLRLQMVCLVSLLRKKVSSKALTSTAPLREGNFIFFKGKSLILGLQLLHARNLHASCCKCANLQTAPSPGWPNSDQQLRQHPSALEQQLALADLSLLYAGDATLIEMRETRQQRFRSPGWPVS